ncbi:MAG: tripartite tricarboxylate transporter substrate binding protein [Natronospirillum sp.]|uniref:tripartite tricarboxylate transporter substrate binding protein n=1 Tax=Natronospirillum sp. TaxID=2812955 RepID=UPI0025CB9D92|nr:tripartite tricarboxylate transporter substrate binding protein [Natronospirillum sp.]MCH8551520.1 tripartite tricarboxylate transporter substrate binding protein [Natronospirillum sp.]
MKTKRFYWPVILLPFFWFTGVPALSDHSFPSRPLTMLIGYGPGGSTDVQGRVLVEILSEQLGQPVDIVYQPGAGGGVAAAMLAGSADQGYVFQYGSSLAFTIAPLIAPASYELNSFRFVAGVTLDQPAIVTGPDKPFETWYELMDYSEDNPELVYVTPFSQDRFIIRRIAEREGLDLRILPAAGGSEMAPLVLSGDADIATSGGTHSAYTDSGDMIVLVSLADERLVYYPDAPTLRELGYDFSMHAVRVVVVPAETPDEQVRVLSEALEAATRDPRFIEVTEERIRMPVVFKSGEDLNSLFANQVEEHRQLIEDSSF